MVTGVQTCALRSAVWTASQWAIAQWAAARAAQDTAGGGPPSTALVLACFLAVLGGGWRRLYGFAKAHDSLVPKGVQRRLDAQADAGLPAGAGPPEGDGAGD